MTLRNIGVGLVGLVALVQASNADIIERLNQVNQIEYTAEPQGEDYWQTPHDTMTLKTGDCEDVAFLLEYLLKKDGIESEVKVGMLAPFAPQMHAWVEVDYKGTKYILDATSGSMVMRDKLSSFEYIPIEGLKRREWKERFQTYYSKVEEEEKQYKKDFKE
jgi:predicted transglutaminase-like cysteine proteinase